MAIKLVSGGITMKMYSKKDVRNIVEGFMAKHFEFDYVCLNEEAVRELEEVCCAYGIEVENIKEQ